MDQDKIIIRGLRQNNLKNVSLDVPKGKRAVPTLVSYRNVWTGEKRFLIIDVPEPVLRTAWDEWRFATGGTDPEVFIGDVCSVLETDYPRLYRNVVPLDL